MSALNKQQKTSQKSMKDYTAISTKSTKRLISSVSPTESKEQKKVRYSATNMSILHTTKMDKEEHATVNNDSNQVSDKNLEGALGPLVQQIKLLREFFDDKYSCLDDKYTRLETAITSQKNEVSIELSKLQDSVTNQKKELTITVEQKMETANKKLEQVLKENISLKKTNVELLDSLAKIKTMQLDNNVMLTGIQE